MIQADYEAGATWQGYEFVLPVFLEEVSEPVKVPPSFTAKQRTYALAGVPAPEFVERLLALAKQRLVNSGRRPH